MANSLIVDLLMRTGSFETDTARAARTAQRRAKEIERAFSDAGQKLRNTFAVLTAGLGFAGIMRSFVVETVNAQNEQAQLAAVLRSTEQAAGLSADQLNRMAAEMASRSIFAEGDITRAQTRLLSYTGIVGTQFPKAMQAVVDMAARMGMSVEQSAETVGRALDIPSQGLNALQKQGFRFTETQKAAVLELERTGRTAEAQGIILGALESSYGGAALAARGTLGGALIALQEQLRSLMTGGDDTVPGLTGAIESLTQTLGSQETKQAFANMVNGLSTLVQWTVSATAATLNFSTFLGEWVARGVNGAADPIERLDEKIGELEASLRRSRAWLSVGSQDSAGYKRMTQDVARLTADLDAARRMREDFVRAANMTVPTAQASNAPQSSSTKPTDDELRRLAEAARKREEAAKIAADNERRLKTYTENLQRQLQATQDLSVAETVLADIRAGRLGTSVSKQQTQELLAVAQQIDSARKAAQAAADADAALREQNRRVQENFEASRRAASEQLTEANARVQASFEQTRSLAISVETPMERLNRRLAELNTLAKENPFLSDNVELVGRLRKQVWDEWSESIGAVGKKLDDFGRTFAENAQNLFGDTLYQTWKGSTDGLLQLWGDMLLRMLAQAQAANLARALFGSDDSGNLSGGWLSRIGSAIAGYFGGGGFGTGAQYGNQDYGQYLSTGTNYVPYNGMRAVLHEGEAVVPKKYNPAAGAPVGGGGQRVEVNNYFGSEAQVSTRQGSDGRLVVDFERRVVGAVAADTARGGVTARAVAGRFGMGEGSTLTRRRG